MKICILGMWHLGSVTATCISSLNNEVIALDYDKKIINDLNNLIFPVQEPRLLEIAKKSFKEKKLRFITIFGLLMTLQLIFKISLTLLM